MARVQAAAEWVGFVRVDRVRLVVGCEGTVAYVEGQRRRHHVVERVPLARAVQLTSRGVPVTLAHQRNRDV